MEVAAHHIPQSASVLPSVVNLIAISSELGSGFDFIDQERFRYPFGEVAASPWVNHHGMILRPFMVACLHIVEYRGTPFHIVVEENDDMAVTAICLIWFDLVRSYAPAA